MMQQTPLFELTNVQLVKKGQTILQDITFTVQPGELVGVAGPSGAGKSSLLRLLNLLHSPSGGTIRYQGRDIMTLDPLKLRRQVSYVPQKPFLFGRTVRDNLVYPYGLRHELPNLQEIGDYLQRANLSAKILDQNNGDLSGGEQQRVALVRALLTKPQVLLLDEVTAALDEDNIATLERLITTERAARQLTVLLISHNMAQLRRLAETVLFMEQGRLRYWGAAAEFFRRREAMDRE